MGEGGAGHLRALGHREEPGARGCPQPSHVDSAAPPLSPSLAEGVTGDRMGAGGQVRSSASLLGLCLIICEKRRQKLELTSQG